MRGIYFILFVILVCACQVDDIEPVDEIIKLGKVIISNQEELIDFADTVQETHYGDLRIIHPGPLDLSPLKKLKRIEGSLLIFETEYITNLDGFSNLESIGDNKFLIIGYNQSLENIDGLNKLSGNILAFEIRWNPKLKYINYLGTTNKAYKVYISGNESLKSIEGFSSFEEVQYISISRNTSLSKFANVFNNLHTINENFAFGFNPELTRIQGFDNLSILRNCDFRFNRSLSSINIFQEGSIIELNKLSIIGNERLKNLSGFENINKVSILEIVENENLENLEGLLKIDKVSILHVSENIKLYDFCGIRNIALGTDNFQRFYISNNGYDPTVDEIIDLKCSN